MTAKALFILALVLGGLAGCSTARSAAPTVETGKPLYLYYGYEAWNSAQRYLSTRIRPGEDISVGGDDYLELKGRIDREGTNLVANLTGGTGQEAHFYRGKMILEKPFFAQGGIASGFVIPGWFMVSTNADGLAALKHVNAILGLTNAPYNHPAAVSPSRAAANAPSNTDPVTGLPYGHRMLLDPNTGLPLVPKQAVVSPQGIPLAGTVSAIFAEQATCYSVQVPIGYSGSGTNIVDTNVAQVLLLKKDGTSVSQYNKPSWISLGTVGSFAEDDEYYTFQKVSEDEIAGVVVSYNGKLYNHALERADDVPSSSAGNLFQITPANLSRFPISIQITNVDASEQFTVLFKTDKAIPFEYLHASVDVSDGNHVFSSGAVMPVWSTNGATFVFDDGIKSLWSSKFKTVFKIVETGHEGEKPAGYWFYLRDFATNISAGTNMVDVPPKIQISDIHMFNARDGWAEANDPKGYRLLRTSDGARTWVDITPCPLPFDLWYYKFSSRQTTWITINAHSHPELLMTTNGGGSWTTVSAPFGYFTEASNVRFENDHVAIAKVSDAGMGSQYDTFYQTTDGGMSWALMDIIPPHSDLQDPHTLHISNMNGDTADDYPGGKFIITHGESGDDPPNGYVGLTVSSDSGKTWTEERLPLPAEKSGESRPEDRTQPSPPVFFGARDGLLPVQVFNRPEDQRTFDELVLYRTSDGGQTWTVKQPVALSTNGLAGDDCDVVSMKDIIVRNGRVLNVTHDGARTWHTIQPNIDLGMEASRRDVLRMDFTDAAHGWIIISDDTVFSPDGNFLLYKTSDGGKTWTQLPLIISR